MLSEVRKHVQTCVVQTEGANDSEAPWLVHLQNTNVNTEVQLMDMPSLAGQSLDRNLVCQTSQPAASNTKLHVDRP